ncbi:hypothetical protein [Demequina globuliformis]|uniref:hypothetical protein n=1 Tax=Demequina globuliformis TaxID=676202 RepID=UPI00078035BC|nr:hypothetical protein [Demequina globuliformis]
MTTPIDRAAEAVRPLLDYSLFPEDAPDIARAVFESIDRDQLIELMMRPEHGPMESHDPRTGACLACPEPLHYGKPEDIVDAIITHLTGKDQS